MPARPLLILTLLSLALPLSAGSSRALLSALDTAQGSERLLVLRALGVGGDPKARVALIRLFDVPNASPEESAAIALSLSRHGGREPMKALLRAWDYLESAKFKAAGLPPQLTVLRERILDALAETRDPAALPALRRGLLDDDEVVVERAVAGVAALKDKGSQDWLLRCAESPKPGLAQAALEALGEYGGPRAEAALRAALEKAPAQVQPAAAYGLARRRRDLGRLKLEGWLLEEKEPTETGILAAYYLLRLGPRGGKDALDYLLRIVENDASPLRLRALEALGKAGDPRAVPLLSARLEKETREGRILVAQALGRLGGERAVVALKLLQDDPIREVGEVARYELAGLGEYETP
ncbi:MAG: HEAT repeat domain-containing protein [Elusimicrobiota bacterium]|jgi:HEAT repeat protein